MGEDRLNVPSSSGRTEKKKPRKTEKTVKSLEQKLVLAFVTFFVALVLAIVSLALQDWAVQKTDRYNSRLGLVHRCYKLKVPLLDEECESTLSVDCDDPDYIEQVTPEKRGGCEQTKKTLLACIVLMAVALVFLLIATISCLPRPLRRTSVAAVCGFVSGVLFLSTIFLFRFRPRRDFSYTFFEGSACNGASFGLAVGATFLAWCGCFISTAVTYQQRGEAEKTTKEKDAASSGKSWLKEGQVVPSVSITRASMRRQAKKEDKTDGQDKQREGKVQMATSSV